MLYKVNQAINVRYLAVDKETGLTDLVLTPTSPSGVDGTPVSMTEIGGGLYAAAFTPSVTGEWWVRVSSVLKPTNIYAKSYEVGTDYNLYPSQETGILSDIKTNTTGLAVESGGQLAGINYRLGEVDASPAGYSVVGRIKAIWDLLTGGTVKVKLHDGTTVADVNVKTTNAKGLNTLAMGMSTGDYLPNEESLELSAGDVHPLRIDADGTLETRSSILTDEGSFYETFKGTTLDTAKWDITLGTGASYSVANSRFVLNAGTTASAESYLQRKVDYAPLKLKIRLSVSQRIANQDIYFGFSDSATPEEMSQFARFHLTGTTATLCICDTQSSTDTNGAEGTAETFTVPSTVNYITFGIEVSLEGVSFTMGDTDEESTLICKRYREYPDNYTELYCRLRVLNGSTAPASNTAITVSFIKVQNFNRVALDTPLRHEPLSVKDVANETPGFYLFSGNIAPGNKKHMLSVFNGTGSGRRLRLKGLYINNMQESLISASLIEFAILHQTTAQTGGTTLTAVKTDSAGMSLPTQILLATGATVTGGSTITKYLMNNDELKTDNNYPAPYVTSLQNFLPIFPGMKELTLREGEGFSIQHLNNVTAGTFCFTLLFTLE